MLGFQKDLDHPPPHREQLAARVHALAREAGIAPDLLPRPIAGLDPSTRARAHLVRAVALDPSLLLLEQPTDALGAGDGKPFGDTVGSMAAARALATLIISEDADF